MIIDNNLFDNAFLALPKVITARLEKEIELSKKAIVNLSKSQSQRPDIDYIGKIANWRSYIDGLSAAIEIIKEEVEDYVT